MLSRHYKEKDLKSRYIIAYFNSHAIISYKIITWCIKMKKISSAVMLASVAMLNQQANASEEINIDTSKVSDEMVKAFKGTLLTNNEAKSMLHASSRKFAETIRIDGKSDVIDIQAYLAAGPSSRDDSTGGWSSTISSAASYVNCHGACHGSRSWR